MKILFIAPLPPPVTGHSLACQVLYEFLQKKGHNVGLINLSKKGFKHGVNSFSRVIEIFEIIFNVFLWRKNYDLIYFTPSESLSGNFKDLLIYAVLGQRLSNTYIHLHGGGGMRVLLSSARPWLRYLNGWFLQRLAGVIVLGARHKDIYAGLVKYGQIHVVKNFADDDVFIDDVKLQAKFANVELIHVLFLSNLIPGKGYEYLISAIKMMPLQVRTQFSFDFAGGFESEDAKNDFLESIRNLNEVQYHGIVLGKEKCRLLHKAHIFCLPSYLPEGQPISILEAFAAGCAVITTNCGGVFDIFTPGTNGIEVDYKSAESIAYGLGMFATNHALLQQFGLANVEEARSQYRKQHHLLRLCHCLGLD